MSKTVKNPFTKLDSDPTEVTSPLAQEQSHDDDFDIFAWAANLAEAKQQLNVELFLFNKTFTPFKVRCQAPLLETIKNAFLFAATEAINQGIDSGLTVHDYGEAEDEKNVLYRVKLEKVSRAAALLYLIEHEYKDIAYFSDQEFNFKQIKGIIAKFTLANSADQTSFYVAKNLASSSALKGKLSWELSGESFAPLTSDLAVKIPEYNETLIIGQEVFIFNQSKFEKLFQFDYKATALSDAKAKELNQAYALSLPQGLSLSALLLDKKPLLKKLADVKIGAIKQSELLDYADEMRLDLMTDDNGKIIVMDEKDLRMFINLISEDYFISPVTGLRYEIKGKKLLEEPDGEPPRG